MFDDLTRIRRGHRSLRSSSWDRAGRNSDWFVAKPGQTVVMADIAGPGKITHIWTAQHARLREVLIKMTWDDAAAPSVIAPIGDFFCMGHGLVNDFDSAFFSSSTNMPYQFNGSTAFNCYIPMPFARRAKIELVNESQQDHWFWFYVDYETMPELPEDTGYFHAEFRRQYPFGGWGPEVGVNTAEANIVNTERTAWDNNYVILETKGCGQYIGCNLSVTNFSGTWWGEGDDMIWVDGYHWPPDLHGTGSEDYLSHAWGMQDTRYWRCGSTIWEHDRRTGTNTDWRAQGGYQTSYVFHVENPIRFTKEIKATIEVGHGNHLTSDVCSVAYWYAAKPTRAKTPPPVAKRMPVKRDVAGNWIIDKKAQCPGKPVKLNAEMKAMKKKWADRFKKK
ncbi:MAG: DUF2961 domain-containing protein [Planctomycetaceae bacterium]|nr:DUF2961 domain-containing protein [Planctomycetaceae bacterium]